MMVLRLLLTALAPVLCSVALAQTAPTDGVRVALVIGNSAYKDALLANPVNDASDMADTLEKAGFKVILRRDASSREMRQALREFGNELRRAQVGIFYFAGHGLQIRGANYLLPVGADIQSEADAEDLSLDANYVLRVMEDAQVGTSIIILDACRNNPYSRTFRSSTRGLAQMAAASGSLVAFATAPGSVAADGTGRNGLYTSHLLQNLVQPNVDILRAFQRTRAAVMSASGGKQTPWESTSLTGDFYLRPSSPEAPVEAVAARAKGPLDGVWVAKDERWQVRVSVEQGRASGLLRCASQKTGAWGAWGSAFIFDIPPARQPFSAAGAPTSGWSPRVVSGIFPTISVTAEKGARVDCPDGTITLQREN